MFPGAAPCSPLPLNGHCVNPLKVNPPAAVTRQSRTTRWREETRKGKERKREKTTTGSEKEMCSWIALWQPCGESKADCYVKVFI